MNPKSIAFTLLCLLMVTGVRAQNSEHYFRFLLKQPSDVDWLTRVISIDDVRGDTVYAYANDEEWQQFQATGITFEELPHPSSLFEHRMSDDLSSMLDWDTYPTYAGYLSMMRLYATNYPNLCKLDTVGYSVQGRLLLAVKISDSVTLREDEPQFFYTSTMHGDETVGYVLMLRLIDYLLTQYGQQTTEGQRVTRLVQNMEIWINPNSNPDGTYRLGGDTTVSNARRFNANNVDLNRNFPDRISDTSNTTTGRQAETQAMMRWTARHNFSLSANFHGGAQVANYPWDNGTPSGTYSACPDDAWFIQLSLAYATPNPDLMSGGFPNGITNGCLWYVVFGGRQDWIYWWYGGRETTIELYNTKNPPGSLLPQRWNNNRESFLAYMEYALKGVRGIVTDAATGLPLRARVSVQEAPSVFALSDSTVGDYHRLLLPGTYTLTATANGYRPDTIRSVTVLDTGATRVNIALHSSSSGVAEESSSPSQIKLLQNYPNPFNASTTITFTLPFFSSDLRQLQEGMPVSLSVFDLLGREVAAVLDERRAPGTFTVPFDAGVLASGTYVYRLTTPVGTLSRKLLLLK